MPTLLQSPSLAKPDEEMYFRPPPKGSALNSQSQAHHGQACTYLGEQRQNLIGATKPESMVTATAAPRHAALLLLLLLLLGLHATPALAASAGAVVDADELMSKPSSLGPKKPTGKPRVKPPSVGSGAGAGGVGGAILAFPGFGIPGKRSGSGFGSILGYACALCQRKPSGPNVRTGAARR
jgi:hypothetical protein